MASRDRSTEVGRTPSDTTGTDGRAPNPEPGLLLIQIDGLSAPDLDSARSRGLVPALDGLVRAGHRLSEWSCGLPSDTLAVQASLFWGACPPAPSFAWWDRDSRRSRLAASASAVASFEHAFEAGYGPGLLRGGGCHAGAIGGGAAGGVLVPPAGRRTWGAMVRESIHAASESLADRWPNPDCLRETRRRGRFTEGVAPALSRLRRLGAFAVATTGRASGHVVAAGAREDVTAGRPVIFANLVEYDLVAHVAGPRSTRALDALASTDDHINSILRGVEASARPYRVVILSDHGVAPAVPAPAAFLPDPRAWVHDEWQRRRRANSGGDLVVAASGTVLQAWVASSHVRLGLQDLSRRAPGFVEAITRHPAVQATIVADSLAQGAGSSYVVFGRSGGVRFGRQCSASHPVQCNHDAPLVVVDRWGDSPLRTIGPPEEVEAHLNAFAARPDIGDVTCLASPARGRSASTTFGDVWAFEVQFGAHGGVGGVQTQAFILWPPDSPVAPDVSGGAQALHEWLEVLAPHR